MTGAIHHPTGIPVRPFLATPALREAARLAARKATDLKHRSEPTPRRVPIWEAFE